VRALRVAAFALLFPASLVAQLPTSGSGSVPAAVTPGWSLSFDPAALLDGHLRIGLEAPVLDRWTVDLTASRTRTSGVTLDTGYVCGWWCWRAYRGTSSRYSAWSVEVAARHYPVVLSFDRTRRGLAIYVGAFMGYYRSAAERWVNAMPAPSTLSPQLPDRPIADTQPPIPLSTPPERRITTWDGGAQGGLRLVPRVPLFIDVTCSITWATIGRWVSRFDAVVGIAW